MNQPEIYVGNFPYETKKEEIQDFFSQYGEISDVKLIMDFETGQSKGFGFIKFASQQECENALSANGVEFGNRKLRVNMAQSKDNRGGGRGGRGGRNFGDNRRRD